MKKVKHDIFIPVAVLACTAIIVFLVILIILALLPDRDVPIAIKLKNWIHNEPLQMQTSDAELAHEIYGTTQPGATSFPAKKGSTGYEVQLMQRFLNTHCSAKIIEDGYWGRSTEKAIAKHLERQTEDSPLLVWKNGNTGSELDDNGFNAMLNIAGISIMK